MKLSSLRLRLSLFFSTIALLVWLIAGAVAYFQTRHGLDEVFDTQQILFAKSLASADLETLLQHVPRQLPKTKRLIRHGDRGEEDDDVLAFAIFDQQGRMLLNDGKHGDHFPFSADTSGFAERLLADDKDPWRLLYLTSKDQRFRIVVGQEIEYREDMAMQLTAGQLLPWLIALPFLLLAIVWLIGHELASLRRVAHELDTRRPDDATSIAPERVPSETRPLINALNTLFKRTTEMLARERRFTADAAHELRTPLAALRVQAEVAQLAGNDSATRDHALAQLILGIDRSTRLVEQLLALSRLDPLTAPAENLPIDWRAMAQAALHDAQPFAAARRIELSYKEQAVPLPRHGSPTLLALLLRNLLDNASRYTPEGSHVTLTLSADGFTVEDDGPGVAPEHLAQLHQRFFRPPGQSQPGSGLGLSIVERIADLHGLKMVLRNRPEGGFSASVTVL